MMSEADSGDLSPSLVEGEVELKIMKLPVFHAPFVYCLLFFLLR